MRFVGTVFVAIWIGTFVVSAQAAFQNGIETFDGTVVDTATWHENLLRSDVEQNDALFVNALDGSAELTANSVALAIGQTLSAEVTITATSDVSGQSQLAWLGIRSNVNGVPGVDTVGGDTRLFQVEAWQNFEADFSGVEMSDGSGSYRVLQPDIVPQLNQTYVLTLQRLAAGSISYSAAELDGVQINTLTRDVTPFAGDMFVVLGADSANAIFDNVTITPEPSIAQAIFIVTITSLAYRRHKYMH